MVNWRSSAASRRRSPTLRHATRVRQTIEGDGALVFFGYPEAREDAAESALSMALDLVHAMASARFTPALQMQIRVGIASGPLAILKEPRVARGEPYVGLIIDMAERLRALAEPDTVLTCDATKRLAARFFEYEDLGLVNIKGFEDGVRAWRVVRKSAVISRFDAQRYDESRSEIIGRSEVLARSRTRGRGVRGKGRTICLVGGPASASRACPRCARFRQARRATVLNIDCTPSTATRPCFRSACCCVAWPTSRGAHHTAKRAIGRRSSSRDSWERPTCPTRSAISRPCSARGGPPSRGREAGPRAGSDDRPRRHDPSCTDRTRSPVLLCEDLHCRPHDASIIDRLAADIGDRGMLMIARHVPSRSSAESGERDVDRACTSDPAHSLELVRFVAQGAALSDTVIQDIVDRCEGVPLFLEEVTRSTVDMAHAGESLRIDAEPAGAVPTPSSSWSNRASAVLPISSSSCKRHPCSAATSP